MHTIEHYPATKLDKKIDIHNNVDEYPGNHSE